MEKKPTNPYFSVSVGKEKKYLNVVVTSGKENPSVVSVNALASAKEILLALPVQNMPSSCNEIEGRSIAAEFEDFENFRVQCKARAKAILALMKQAEA